MAPELKIKQIIDITWTSYCNKVATRLYKPENEKMMQLQLSLILQTLVPLYEYSADESIKVLLEEPVNINRIPNRRIIDIVLLHTLANIETFYPIELKCFRKYTRGSDTKTRGAQNLGMYDYWMDIENLEQYTLLPNYSFGTHLALCDDEYYVTGKHNGAQVKVYSTGITKQNVTGKLEQPIASRQGLIELLQTHETTHWQKIGNFYFIKQDIPPCKSIK